MDGFIVARWHRTPLQEKARVLTASRGNTSPREASVSTKRGSSSAQDGGPCCFLPSPPPPLLALKIPRGWRSKRTQNRKGEGEEGIKCILEAVWMLCNWQSCQAPVSSLRCAEVTSSCALQQKALNNGAILIHPCTSICMCASWGNGRPACLPLFSLSWP